MTQLSKFTFNIKTSLFTRKVRIELQSNEDVPRSIMGRGYQQVASYVHTDSWQNAGGCHIYSLSYACDYLLDLDNWFQSGVYDKVQYLSVADF